MEDPVAFLTESARRFEQGGYPKMAKQILDIAVQLREGIPPTTEDAFDSILGMTRVIKLAYANSPENSILVLMYEFGKCD